MIMNGSYGGNSFCGGGDFTQAAGDTAYEHIKSMDYESAVPYTSMMEEAKNPSSTPEVHDPVTKEFNTIPLNPVHFFNTQNKELDNDKKAKPIVIFEVGATNKAKGLGVEEDKVTLVK